MEQLTLEQEINRIPEVPDHYIEGEPDSYIEGWKVGMKEGAEWQKQQYKQLKALAFFAEEKLRRTAADGLATLIKNELERLQD